MRSYFLQKWSKLVQQKYISHTGRWASSKVVAQLGNTRQDEPTEKTSSTDGNAGNTSDPIQKGADSQNLEAEKQTVSIDSVDSPQRNCQLMLVRDTLPAKEVLKLPEPLNPICEHEVKVTRDEDQSKILNHPEKHTTESHQNICYYLPGQKTESTLGLTNYKTISTESAHMTDRSTVNSSQSTQELKPDQNKSEKHSWIHYNTDNAVKLNYKLMNGNSWAITSMENYEIDKFKTKGKIHRTRKYYSIRENIQKNKMHAYNDSENAKGNKRETTQITDRSSFINNVVSATHYEPRESRKHYPSLNPELESSIGNSKAITKYKNIFEDITRNKKKFKELRNKIPLKRPLNIHKNVSYLPNEKGEDIPEKINDQQKGRTYQKYERNISRKDTRSFSPTPRQSSITNCSELNNNETQLIRSKPAHSNQTLLQRVQFQRADKRSLLKSITEEESRASSIEQPVSLLPKELNTFKIADALTKRVLTHSHYCRDQHSGKSIRAMSNVCSPKIPEIASHVFTTDTLKSKLFLHRKYPRKLKVKREEVKNVPYVGFSEYSESDKNKIDSSTFLSTSRKEKNLVVKNPTDHTSNQNFKSQPNNLQENFEIMEESSSALTNIPSKVKKMVIEKPINHTQNQDFKSHSRNFQENIEMGEMDSRAITNIPSKVKKMVIEKPKSHTENQNFKSLSKNFQENSEMGDIGSNTLKNIPSLEKKCLTEKPLNHTPNQNFKSHSKNLQENFEMGPNALTKIPSKEKKKFIEKPVAHTPNHKAPSRNLQENVEMGEMGSSLLSNIPGIEKSLFIEKPVDHYPNLNFKSKSNNFQDNVEQNLNQNTEPLYHNQNKRAEIEKDILSRLNLRIIEGVKTAEKITEGKIHETSIISEVVNSPLNKEEKDVRNQESMHIGESECSKTAATSTESTAKEGGLLVENVYSTDNETTITSQQIHDKIFLDLNRNLTKQQNDATIEERKGDSIIDQVFVTQGSCSKPFLHTQQKQDQIKLAIQPQKSGSAHPAINLDQLKSKNMNYLPLNIILEQYESRNTTNLNEVPSLTPTLEEEKCNAPTEEVPKLTFKQHSAAKPTCKNDSTQPQKCYLDSNIKALSQKTTIFIDPNSILKQIKSRTVPCFFERKKPVVERNKSKKKANKAEPGTLKVKKTETPTEIKSEQDDKTVTNTEIDKNKHLTNTSRVKLLKKTRKCMTKAQVKSKEKAEMVLSRLDQGDGRMKYEWSSGEALLLGSTACASEWTKHRDSLTRLKLTPTPYPQVPLGISVDSTTLANFTPHHPPKSNTIKSQGEKKTYYILSGSISQSSTKESHPRGYHKQTIPDTDKTRKQSHNNNPKKIQNPNMKLAKEPNLQPASVHSNITKSSNPLSEQNPYMNTSSTYRPSFPDTKFYLQNPTYDLPNRINWDKQIRMNFSRKLNDYLEILSN